MNKRHSLNRLEAAGALTGAALALASIAHWSPAAAGLVAGIVLVAASLRGSGRATS